MSEVATILSAKIVSLDQLRAGRCTVTVEPPKEWAAAHDRTHLTYRFTRSEDGNVTFVSVLNGPNNTTDYVYLGILPKDAGEVRWTRKSVFGPDDLRVKVIQRVVSAIAEGRAAQISNAGWNVHSSGLCCRCGRKLTVPASVQTGIGPECESLHRLGVASWDEIPSRISTPIACQQYVYWTTSDATALLALHDLLIEAGKDEQYAEDLVAVTRKAMRKFKGGKNLSKEWIDYATW